MADIYLLPSLLVIEIWRLWCLDPTTLPIWWTCFQAVDDQDSPVWDVSVPACLMTREALSGKASAFYDESTWTRLPLTMFVKLRNGCRKSLTSWSRAFSIPAIWSCLCPVRNSVPLTAALLSSMLAIMLCAGRRPYQATVWAYLCTVSSSWSDPAEVDLVSSVTARTDLRHFIMNYLR